MAWQIPYSLEVSGLLRFHTKATYHLLHWYHREQRSSRCSVCPHGIFLGKMQCVIWKSLVNQTTLLNIVDTLCFKLRYRMVGIVVSDLGATISSLTDALSPAITFKDIELLFSQLSSQPSDAWKFSISNSLLYWRAFSWVTLSFIGTFLSLLCWNHVSKSASCFMLFRANQSSFRVCWGAAICSYDQSINPSIRHTAFLLSRRSS